MAARVPMELAVADPVPALEAPTVPPLSRQGLWGREQAREAQMLSLEWPAPVSLLARRPAEELGEQLQADRRVHQEDLADGYGRVVPPHALARNDRSAPVEWRWRWVFPHRHRWREASSGAQGRHSFATRLLERGQDIGTIQEPLGHQQGLCRQHAPHPCRAPRGAEHHPPSRSMPAAASRR